MKVDKENRFYLYRQKGGKMVIYANIDGKQKVLYGFPEVGDDLEVSHWQGNVRDNKNNN